MKELKTPVSIEIKSADTLVALWNLFNWCSRIKFEKEGRDDNIPEWAENLIKNSHGNLWNKIDMLCKVNGINPKREDYQPNLRVGDYDIEVLANGDLKAGCQRVKREDLLKLIQESDKNANTAHGWPKYIKFSDSAILRFDDKDNKATWLHKDNKPNKSMSWDYSNAQVARYTKLTEQEVRTLGFRME